MKKETLIRATQSELKKMLIDELEKHSYAPISGKKYLYAEGTVPVLLVAHLDTVHKDKVTTIWKAYNGDWWSAHEGIGGDDRCGVYAILKIIKRYHVHVLFCEDEEIGGVGASKFVKSGIKPDVNFIIEFDRKGDEDAVFYDCDNPEFTKYICEFGFKEAYGTFSDISTIAPALGVAAVNLSSGYYYPHTNNEIIVWSDLDANIAKVCKMLGGSIPKFEYIESAIAYGGYYSSYGKYYNYSGKGTSTSAYDYYDDYSYEGENKWEEHTYLKSLMPFNGMIKLNDGSLEEVFEDDLKHMVDETGTIYTNYWMDVYSERYGVSAIDPETSMPIRFDAERAFECPVYEW